jgi:hypothetical protein
MIILRVPPYPLMASIEVPQADEFYYVYIEDSAGDLLVDSVYESSGYTISIELPEDGNLYDETYLVSVYETDGEEQGNKVVEETLEIVRPYTAITGDTATEIEQNQAYEELARLVIDSVTGGFYYKKTVLQTTGLGNDYIPVWEKPHKILTVIENNVIVWNHIDGGTPGFEGYDFHLTDDRTAITRHISGEYDRNESDPLFLPTATSDLLDIYGRGGVMFPNGYDYVFILETGYKTIPSDIKRATDLLIEDIKCGKLDYYKRYVKSYSTDQFKLDYDARMMDRTGNLVVDKILEKYMPTIHKFGVL